MLLAGLVPLIGAGWLVVSFTDASLREQALRDAERSGQLSQRLMDERGERLLVVARVIAISPLIRDAVAARDSSRLATVPWVQMQSAQLGDLTVTISDAQGTVLIRSHAPDRYGDNFYDALWGLQEALAGRPGYTVERAGTRGLALRGFGVIESEGQVIGAVVATQNLDREFRGSLVERIGLDAFFAYPDGTTTGVTFDPTMARSLQGSGPRFAGLGQVDGREQAVYAWQIVDPAGEVEGHLGVVIPLHSLQASRAQLAKAAGLVALAVVLVSALLAWLLSRALLGRLEAITRAATAIASGEDRQIPKVGSGDELEALSSALGTMVASLSEQTHRLTAVNAALSEASRLKSQFLANMSHELRTPLHSIVGFSELLLDEPPGGEDPDVRRTHLQTIHTSGQHLLSLINDILDLSKVEAGRMELYCEPFRLAETVAEVLQTLEPLAAQKHIALVDEAAGAGILEADPGRVKQILFNLLSNAIKFTPDGGKVTVSVRRFPDTVQITVADTGIGISPEDQAILFQEFHQLDSGFSRRYQGTGLGLALTKRFVELHGGRIWVESEPGKGSRFYVALPSGGTTLSEPRPADRTAARKVAASVGDDRPLVLVVEDDPDAAGLICAILDRGGYRCEVATDGRQAIDKARALQPTTITLDIMLPEVDGWEVLRTLKEDEETRDIPIAIVSIVENEQLAYALGAADYFVKPIDRQALLARLDSYAVASKVGEVSALAIDDDPAVVELLASTLTAAGYRVLPAVRVEDGVAIARRERPDVILLDVGGPGGRGFSLLATLRNDPALRDIPILAVSARSLTEDGEKWLGDQLEAVLRRHAATGQRSAAADRQFRPGTASAGVVEDDA